MRITSKAIGLGLALAATLALAGCMQPPSPVIPTSEPTAAPVFKSDADALAAAKRAYLAYLAVSDQILSDGGRGASRLRDLATVHVREEDEKGFDGFETKHWHSTGGTTIDAIRLEDYAPSNTRDTVTVYACLDVTKVDVLDADGQSVVSTTRPPLQQVQVTFDLSSSVPPTLLVSGEEPWTGSAVCP